MQIALPVRAMTIPRSVHLFGIARTTSSSDLYLYRVSGLGAVLRCCAAGLASRSRLMGSVRACLKMLPHNVWSLKARGSPWRKQRHLIVKVPLKPYPIRSFIIYFFTRSDISLTLNPKALALNPKLPPRHSFATSLPSISESFSLRCSTMQVGVAQRGGSNCFDC